MNDFLRFVLSQLKTALVLAMLGVAVGGVVLAVVYGIPRKRHGKGTPFPWGKTVLYFATPIPGLSLQNVCLAEGKELISITNSFFRWRRRKEWENGDIRQSLMFMLPTFLVLNRTNSDLQMLAGFLVRQPGCILL